MTFEQEVQSLLEEFAPNFECSICSIYSGRGMYGRRCFGVTGSREFLMKLLLTVQSQLSSNGNDKIIPTPSSDNMAFDEIWYWPQWETS